MNKEQLIRKIGQYFTETDTEEDRDLDEVYAELEEAQTLLAEARDLLTNL